MLSRFSDILGVVVLVPVLAAFVLLEYGCVLFDALRCVSLLLMPLFMPLVLEPVLLVLPVVLRLAVFCELEYPDCALWLGCADVEALDG